MNAARREADLTTPPGAAGEPLLGLIYLDVSGGQLQYLNEAGRQLHEGGLPVLGHEPSLGRLRAPGGENVPPAALPLALAAREARAVEARYVLSRPGLAEWHLHWTASPLLDAAGHVSAVVAAVCCTPPQPDWHTLAGLAHDLRTPLQTLRFLAAAFGQAPPRPEDLGRLQCAAERTQQIGADLLDWCRAPLQGGRLVEADWFALAPLLDELVQEQQGTAERKGVALRGEVTAAAGWDICTDRVRLGRALANLLSNAVRYTAGGGQVVLTAAWRGEGDERALALEVTDTGAGISPEELESIFQPFARGSAGRGDSSGGSGLGLAVVDRLVKELGLRRGFDSEHGRGSDFRVLVPARLLRGGAPSI